MQNDKIQLLIADNNEKEINSLLKELEKHKGIHLAGQTDCGLDAVAMVREMQPDAVILGLDLPDGTAIDFLYQVRELDQSVEPLLLILADQNYTPELQRARLGERSTVFLRGAPDFEAKKIIRFLRRMIPIGGSSRGRQEHVIAKEADNVAGRLRERITMELCTIYITPNLRGHHFIREAVLMLIDIPPGEPPYHVTKVIYPALAEQFETTSANVEHCIRTALNYAWSKPDILEMLSKVYPAPADLSGGRPSNRAFLYTYAEKFRKRNKEK